MTEALATPEYTPFDHRCENCEHEPLCFLPLKVINKVSYQWFRYLKFTDRDHFCQQGKKRRGRQYRQAPDQITIAQCNEIARKKAAGAS